MKVYSVRKDVDRYQYFLPADEKDAVALTTTGQPWSGTWSPPSVVVYQPRLKQGDFFNFSSDTLIANSRATENLRAYFEASGELLPLPYNGVDYTLVNVTNVLDCQDEEKTAWKYAVVDGVRRRGRKGPYHFRSDAFSDSMLFKIPEQAMTSVFLVEGLRDPT
jgi:hypothetical protein